MIPAAVKTVDRRMVALAAGIATIALAGAALGTAEILGTGGATAPPPSTASATFRAGQDVPVSFGVIAVDHIDRVAGLTGQQVSGGTHFPSYVPADRMSISIAFAATNLQTVRSAALDPADVTLRLRSGREVAATATTLGPIRLQPAASVTGRITFVVPRGARGMKLVYHDPGASSPAVIDLGTGSVAREAGGSSPAPLFPGFHRHG